MPVPPISSVSVSAPPLPVASGTRQEAQNDLVLSFHLVRRALGALGFALPVLLLAVAVLTPEVWYASISEFYHGRAGDLFVGILSALGVFLWSYIGYRDPDGAFPSDRLMARVAGGAAVLVAFVPTKDKTEPLDRACSLLACALDGVWAGAAPIVHYGTAGVFFLALAVMCMVNFRRTGTDPKTAAEQEIKQRKNRVFLACGVTILVAVVVLGVFGMIYVRASESTQDAMDTTHFVFVLETVAVWAFALAWLIKGEVPFLLKWFGIEDPAA